MSIINKPPTQQSQPRLWRASVSRFSAQSIEYPFPRHTIHPHAMWIFSFHLNSIYILSSFSIQAYILILDFPFYSLRVLICATIHIAIFSFHYITVFSFFGVDFAAFCFQATSVESARQATSVVKEFSFLDGPLPTVIFLIIVNLFHLGVKFFSLSARWRIRNHRRLSETNKLRRIISRLD